MQIAENFQSMITLNLELHHAGALNEMILVAELYQKADYLRLSLPPKNELGFNKFRVENHMHVHWNEYVVNGRDYVRGLSKVICFMISYKYNILIQLDLVYCDLLRC